MTKGLIRKKVRLQRASLDNDLKARWDMLLNIALINLVLERKPKTIHCYLPLSAEVDLMPFIRKVLQNNIHLVVPKVIRKPYMEHLTLNDLNQLESGPFGTQHPINGIPYNGPINIIIVPGLAFAPSGYRIGYGGGFYDHFLVNQPDASKIAVCYPFQVFGQLPIDGHDIPIDKIYCPQEDGKLKYQWQKIEYL